MFYHGGFKPQCESFKIFLMCHREYPFSVCELSSHGEAALRAEQCAWSPIVFSSKSFYSEIYLLQECWVQQIEQWDGEVKTKVN